jgi:hypothetical protein
MKKMFFFLFLIFSYLNAKFEYPNYLTIYLNHIFKEKLNKCFSNILETNKIKNNLISEDLSNLIKNLSNENNLIEKLFSPFQNEFYEYKNYQNQTLENYNILIKECLPKFFLFGNYNITILDYEGYSLNEINVIINKINCVYFLGEKYLNDKEKFYQIFLTSNENEIKKFPSQCLIDIKKCLI